MNVFGIGSLEFLVIALVAFLVLGPRKMAEAGKTVAKIMSELRKQRDELTSAILEEPHDQPRPGRTEISAKDKAGGAAAKRPSDGSNGQS